MKAQGRPGSIVLMASMGGIAGAGFTVGFSTSKGGVVLLAKGPRRRAGTARHPSQFRRPRRAIDTQLLRATPEIARAAEGFGKRAPLRRLGQPPKVGDTIAWLGSDLSSYITGTSLLVNGGLLSVI
jgi:L-rhamnose 1-dehydrogenase